MQHTQLTVFEVAGTSYGEKPTGKLSWKSPAKRTWTYTISAKNLTSALDLVMKHELEVKFAEEVGYHNTSYDYYPTVSVVVDEAKTICTLDVLKKVEAK
jgi:hypothetical protein